MNVRWIAAWLVCLTLTPFAFAQGAKTLPVPDAETVQKQSEILEDLYKAKLDKRADAKEAAEFGKFLLARAKETTDNIALRYAALVLVKGLAAGAGDVSTAAEAVDEIALHHTVDRGQLLLEVLTQAAPKLDGLPAAGKLSELAFPLVEEALNDDRHEFAQKMAQTIFVAAKTTGDLKLGGQAKSTLTRIDFAKQEYDRVKPAFAKLKTNPDDGASHLEVGKYFALVRNDWKKGLAHLAKCSSKDWQELAEVELLNPSKGQSQIALAGGWKKLAETEAGQAKTQILSRAYFWYGEALPNVKGLEVDIVQKNLDELAPLFQGVKTQARSVDFAYEQRKFDFVHNETHFITTSADGKLAASAYGFNEEVLLWDLPKGKLLKRLGQGKTLGGANQFNDPQCLAFSPDGKFLAVGNNRNTIQVWDVNSGQLLRTLSGHADYVRAVHYLPDGKLLSVGDDGDVRLWDPNNNLAARVTKVHTGFINGFSISKDGKIFATGGNDRQAKVWDLAANKMLHQFDHPDSVRHVALSPDLKRLATVTFGKSVRVINLDAGADVHQLAHDSSITAMAFTPDGRYLMTATQVDVTGVFPNNIRKGDNDIRIWDVKTGKIHKVLSGHTNTPRALAFSADGSLLLSGGLDGAIRVWGSAKK